MSKATYIDLLREQIEKQDPVNGIIAMIEDTCEVTEDGLIDL